jgi:dipeptidase E
MARLLLISNSTLHGSGYLDHVETEIRDFLKDVTRIAFVPLALYDRNQYAIEARERFRKMGYDLMSIHDVSHPQRARNRMRFLWGAEIPSAF